MNSWKIENLGLIASVQFTRDDQVLRWTDGQWYAGTQRVQRPIAALPHASTMKEARKVGEQWLRELDA